MMLFKAGHRLAAAVTAIITIDMAEALASKPVDLNDPHAVEESLKRSGFGSLSIAALRDRARREAQ